MTKARQLADLGNAYDDGALSNRNLIINGSMQVAQRGTSQTNSSYGSVDRWYIYSSGGTFTQETSSPPEGFSHYLTCTSATGSVIVSQAIELPATGSAGVFYNGQTITISYYAKSTSAGDALYNPISFRNGVTSITNLVSVESDSSDTNVLTTSWARYSKTYTIGVNLNSNNTCLVIQPRTNGAPSGNISITGVQLEVGDTATPYEHKNVGQELLACQRYYKENEPSVGMVLGGDLSKCAVPIAINNMRATPSITILETGNSLFRVGQAAYSVTAAELETTRNYITFTTNVNGIANEPRTLNPNVVSFDAEL